MQDSKKIEQKSALLGTDIRILNIKYAIHTPINWVGDPLKNGWGESVNQFPFLFNIDNKEQNNEHN